MPVGMFDPLPRVIATYEDATKEELFAFYPDEISFTEQEFVGLTKEEAMALRTKKDKEHLQS